MIWASERIEGSMNFASCVEPSGCPSAGILHDDGWGRRAASPARALCGILWLVMALGIAI